MSYLLYEVWTEDEDGHQELVETTASLTEAKAVAKKSAEEGSFLVTIFRETDDGDVEEIEKFEHS